MGDPLSAVRTTICGCAAAPLPLVKGVDESTSRVTIPEGNTCARCRHPRRPPGRAVLGAGGAGARRGLSETQVDRRGDRLVRTFPDIVLASTKPTRRDRPRDPGQAANRTLFASCSPRRAQRGPDLRRRQSGLGVRPARRRSRIHGFDRERDRRSRRAAARGLGPATTIRSPIVRVAPPRTDPDAPLRLHDPTPKRGLQPGIRGRLFSAQLDYVDNAYNT